MSYGQINYPQNLGTGPSVDTIADVGCFLTAFCNLLERFGEPVDPPSLNNYFISHGTYLPDGPNRDNLGWGSVSAYNGNVVSTGVGGAGWPQTNDAIVKFIYKSQRSGAQVTHFCLVVDWTQRIILDSYDGKVKVSPYGNPVAWSSYRENQSQVVAPPVPVDAASFHYEAIAPHTYELKIATHLWDLNQRSWPALVNNPAGDGPQGKQFTTTRLATHIMGGKYYIPDGEPENHGYNVVDCQEPTTAPAPAAPVETLAPATPQSFTTNVVDGITYTVFDGAPKAMYINKPGGAEKWQFGGVNNWRDFKSVEHVDYGTQVFIVGKALHPIPPTGAMYYMVDPDFGDFKKTGNIEHPYGFNKVDLSETRPAALAPVVAPEPVIEAKPIVAEAPADWRDTFKEFPNPVHYIAARDITVSDLSGQQPNMPLGRYVPGAGDATGIVSAFGTVNKDGVDYYRLKTNNDPKFSYWYCVPKIDPVTHTPNLLVKPVAPGTPVTKTTVARDALHLARTRLETDVPKFLDDIMPKWLTKNKK